MSPRARASRALTDTDSGVRKPSRWRKGQTCHGGGAKKGGGAAPLSRSTRPRRYESVVRQAVTPRAFPIACPCNRSDAQVCSSVRADRALHRRLGFALALRASYVIPYPRENPELSIMRTSMHRVIMHRNICQGTVAGRKSRLWHALKTCLACTKKKRSLKDCA